MGYKPRPDKNRLDEAKERALEILKKLPDTSQVFVVDSAEPGVPVALSPAAARKRIDGLAIRAANRPLNAAVGQAYEGVAGSDRPRHEVYVLTDLARSSWNPSQPVEGLERIKKVKSGVSTFVLRLTPKEPHDVAVVAAEPSPSVAIQGEPVRGPRQAPLARPRDEASGRVLPRRRQGGSEGRRPARQRRGRGALPVPQARPRRRAAPGRGAHRRRPTRWPSTTAASSRSPSSRPSAS